MSRYPRWFEKMMEDGKEHELRVLHVKQITAKGAMFTLGHPTNPHTKAVRIYLRNPFI